MDRIQEILEALADAASLSNDELVALQGELRELYQEQRSGELTEEVIATLQSIADHVAGVDFVLGERAEAVAELERQASELDALVIAEAEAVVDAEAEVVAEETPAEAPVAEAEAPAPEVVEETTDEPVLETVTAAAPAPAPLAAINANQPPAARPRAVTTRPRVTAAAGVSSLTAGGEITDRMQLAQAMLETQESFLGTQGSGVEQKFRVARIHGVYSDDRRLSARNSAEENMARIHAVTSPEAITAAGGICAPTTPYYGLEMISQAARPVRDALATFQADRGGINWITPPQLTDVDTAGADAAVGQITAAQDLAGSTKSHQTVTCGTPQSAQIYAVTKILEFGNLMGRTFPEEVATWTDLTNAAFARFADNLLLTAIGAGSTAVTEVQVLGAARDLFNYVNLAATAYRNRHRMDVNAKLRVMFPYWVVAAIQNDLVASAFNEGVDTREVTEADITRWFNVRNVNVTFFQDGVTPPGNPSLQIFGAQAAGALNNFAKVCVWYLFHEGAWLLLDGGTLDLGVVRDSTLNASNKFQIFAETFENVVMTGIESQKHTTTICVNGGSAGTIDPNTICDGGS